MVELARPVARVEFGYAVVLISAFILPAWAGYRTWIPALAVAVALAAAHGAIAGLRPLMPVAIVGYIGAYLVAGVHSDPDTFSLIEAGKYFAPPVFALAIAWPAQDVKVRERLVLLVIAAVAIQVPVVLGEVIDILIRHGGDAVGYVDAISGMLGDQQGSPLAQVGLLVAVLLIAAAYVGKLSPALGSTGGVIAIGLGLLTSTRASYLLAPLGLLVLAATIWASRTRQHRASRMSPWFATTLVIVVVPVLFFGTQTLFPGANQGINSITGLITGLDRGDQQFDIERDLAATQAASGGSGGTATESEPVVEETPITVLPGRGRQIEIALELSVDDGPLVFLLGRGLGATRFKDQGLLSETGQTTDPVTRPEQNTNGVWLARTISETGYVGLLAFLGLLGYMVVLWWRNRDLLAEPSWDAALILALPAIAALTFASAGYNTILAIQPYAAVFWAFLGIAIAIDARSKTKPAARPVRT